MSTLQEIESAIHQLSSSQRWDLLHRLQDQLWDEWDHQIESDHEAGHLAAIITEVRSDISSGNLKSLSEVIDNT